MEAEERPTKIRKLEQHGADNGPAPDIISKNEASATIIVPVGEEAQVDKENDDISELSGPDADINETKLDDEAAVSDLAEPTAEPLSKNQLRRLRRKEHWAAAKADRKVKKKQKLKEKKERRRIAREELAATQNEVQKDESAAGATNATTAGTGFKKAATHVRLPVTMLIDCNFDELMTEHEVISLAQQITRCYSANNHAPYQGHMMLSSFGARLRERFETVLFNQHKNWKGVQCLDEDFVQASEKAKELMSSPKGGKLAGSFADDAHHQEEDHLAKEGEVVYLTSDSPDTLDELKPYSTYIIGGLVDKNRHKGICYRRAIDEGIRTAKLPIGLYMEMNSRYVLTTNHVCEIMVKWLEKPDWGEAFMAVMPKRKGGSLKIQKADIEPEALEDLGGEIESVAQEAEADQSEPEEVEIEVD